MGLDTTHGAFHGSYGAFNRFRKVVARAMGGSFPSHDDQTLDPDHWYWGLGYSAETHPGLNAFLASNDCEGAFPPELCAKIADEIEALLPQIDKFGLGGGHIERDGGYGAVARRYIKGCRDAAAVGETLEYH